MLNSQSRVLLQAQWEQDLAPPHLTETWTAIVDSSSCGRYGFVKLMVTVEKTPPVVILRSWPEVEWDESCASCFLHVQINSLCDYADSLKLITFVVFLLWVIENCKSALPEKSPQYHSGVGRRPGMPFLNLSNTYHNRCCGPSSKGPRRRLLQSVHSTDAWIMLCSNEPERTSLCWIPSSLRDSTN